MQEDRVPFGVVLITIGLIMLLTVTAVWFLRPELMPRPVYSLVSSYLASTETAVSTAPILLPETPLETAPTTGSSATLINSRDGATPHLRIPRIGVEAPIEPVSLLPLRYNGQTYYQWQVPNNDAVGWHNQTAVFGEPGNTVLNGHHNIHGEVFRDLVELSEGDEIIVFDGEQERLYQVTNQLVLEEQGQSLEIRTANASWISPTEDERLTLITCWPYTSNSHRVVVVAHPSAQTDS